MSYPFVTPSAAPSGPAGGALSGTYPNPGLASGSTSKGKATLSAGTATVAASQVTANSVILLTPQPGTAPLALPYVSSITAGTGFVITSLNVTDASTVGWEIIG